MRFAKVKPMNTHNEWASRDGYDLESFCRLLYRELLYVALPSPLELGLNDFIFSSFTNQERNEVQHI
jgi:hypothetical protein